MDTRHITVDDLHNIQHLLTWIYEVEIFIDYEFNLCFKITVLRCNVLLTTVVADKTTAIVINRACCKKNHYFFPTFGAKWHSQAVNKILQNALTNCQPSISWEPTQTQPILWEFDFKHQ
jgi:hypothetical protein